MDGLIEHDAPRGAAQSGGEGEPGSMPAKAMTPRTRAPDAHWTETSQAGSEGRAAQEAGVGYCDCPYIGGEDKWAWQQGWLEGYRRRASA
jgi:hypothetical protein